MGLFKKKNNAEESNKPLENAAEAPVKKNRKKKNELAKVLDESVWESVHEELKNNTQFIITEKDGTSRYVAFLFDTMQCGGLAGKDARKDESKGSIIESIKMGSIKTYIRLEMLMDDVFIIIPDLDTIDAMDEFGILADGQYILCTISEDGKDISTVTDSDDNEVSVSFDQIRNLIQNNLDVMSLFPGHGDTTDAMLGIEHSNNASADAPAQEPDDAADDDIDDTVEDLPDDLPDDDDLTDDDDDAPVVKPAGRPVQAAEPQEAAVPQEDTVPADAPAEDVQSDVSAGESDDDGGYDEFEDITEDVINDYVTRKFYSEDLGLEVSTEPFDMQFMHGNSYVPFNENRGSGWLNEYLSNIAKDANVRIQRMHSENLFCLREKYMKLIQEHCTNIAQSLDISDDSTQYGMFRFAIEQNKKENLDAVEDAVTKKREQLNESWTRKLQQVADEAAAAAKAQYEDRYGRSHESDIQNLVSREKDEIERDYQSSLRRMNDDRRAEASKLLDIAVNDTLKEMSDLYMKVLNDEQREYVRLQKEITKFIDDNRKDEKARIEALAEENRQTKKAAEVRKDYAAKIKAMSAEFDMKKTVLQADVDRMRHEHDEEIRKSEAEWTKKLNDEKAHSDDLQKKLDDLLNKYAGLDAEKALEYKNRMDSLQSEKETWQRHTDDIIEEHKKNNMLAIVVIIAAVIAAIGIGFMGGSIVNIRKASQVERSSITQNYQMDNQTPDKAPAADNAGNGSSD